jgi:hypothetical protein
MAGGFYTMARFSKQAILCLLAWLPLFATSQSYDTTVPVISIDSIYGGYDNEDVTDTVPVYDDEEVAYSRLPDTVIFRSVPDSAAMRLKEAREFEYANDPEYWIKHQKKPRQRKGFDYFLNWLFTNQTVRVIFYLLLGGILVFAIYRIIQNNNLFYISSKRSPKAPDEEAEEIMHGDIDGHIRAAIAEKDYRKAVRYLYLKSLHVLDQKGLIRYHPEATNHEYVVQLSAHPLANDFTFATNIYDHVWYGGFELSDERFAEVNNHFQKLHKAAGA